ncbi:MAG: NAD(P)-binding protein [Deltaproteobacteria bacterium]|nr:NAD(P)-binding protein [Deltaproteobacteria bacterium]MBT6489009.1 NAD(P)-binding protein [Deltaproteobacteria bacterium]
MKSSNQWDHIVVGAGAAGSAIAARLSEDRGRNVLLLEAGPDYPDSTKLPKDITNGKRNSMFKHDWGFMHTTNSQQKVPFKLPRGRVVGGSSAVNTCIALRGIPQDYDEWADMGLDEWTWDKCLPAFKKLEADQDFNDEYHNQKGPITIRRHPPEELVPWQAAFLEACDELGYPKCEDHNNPNQTGAGPHAMNKVNGVRFSAAMGYLTPAVRSRANLTIKPDSLAHRVIFYNGQAIGIEVERNGEVQTFFSESIIIACGSIATPGLLLRSGIGAKDDVYRLGVSLVSDVPGVGSRLLDHPGAAFFLAPRPGIARRNDPLIQTLLRYTSEPGAFPNDMQIQPGSCLTLPWGNITAVTMMTCVEKTKGVGKIRWTSAWPHAKPIVESNILDHPEDRRLAVDGLSRAYELTQSKAMRKLAVPVAPMGRILKDKRKLDEWIRTYSDSGYHPCGTVPMGPESDPMAALDQYCRVRGTKGLIVADASIFPTVPSVNIHLPTIMVGERVADFIRSGTI